MLVTHDPKPIYAVQNFCSANDHLRPISLVAKSSLALASLNLTRRDILPTLTATLTTIALDDSSLQRFEART
jgi:hypothetical protein